MGSNRFNLNFDNRDHFLVLHGVVVECLGLLVEVIGDEVGDAGSQSVLRVLLRELLEASEEGLTGGDGDAADYGVVEGGGLGVVVEENRVMEGSHALDVRFQFSD